MNLNIVLGSGDQISFNLTDQHHPLPSIYDESIYMIIDSEYRPGDTLQGVENLACSDEKDESWQETREIERNLQQLAKPHM